MTRSWKDSETCIELVFAIFVWLCCVHMSCANVSVTVSVVVGGVRSYSVTVLSCVASSCRQLLRMMGSGWASVLKTQSSRGRRSSSEKSRYRYLSRQEKHPGRSESRFTGSFTPAVCSKHWVPQHIIILTDLRIRLKLVFLGGKKILKLQKTKQNKKKTATTLPKKN